MNKSETEKWFEHSCCTNNPLVVRDAPTKPAEPNPGELDRAAELSATLAGALRLAESYDLDYIRLDREVAEELCQLLHDSLKTAAQLEKHNGS